jgi:hypothetical protein
MTDSAPARYSLLKTKSAELYQETKVVNNYKVENNRVVSRGVDAKQVAKVSGEEVRQAEIQELPRGRGRNVPAEHLAKQNDKLVIFRPQLPAPNVNYAKNLPPTARRASSGASQTVVSAANDSTRGSRGEPMVLRSRPGEATAAAEHKSFILMVPEHQFAASAQAADPVERRNENARNSAYGEASRLSHTQISPMLGEAPPEKPSPPRYYYPQSPILTPSRPQFDAGAAPASAPVYHQSQILIPPPSSRAEPAPAPVYHPAPVESRPALAPPPPSPPPTQESHSSSSSSASSSGSSHNH